MKKVCFLSQAHYIFCETGNLLRVEPVPDQSIEAALAVYKLIPEDQISSAASFIRECLRLDSSDRASAEDLILHPWLGTACNENRWTRSDEEAYC